MHTLSKYIIAFIAVIAFSASLPQFYSMVFIKKGATNIVFYSEIIDDFLIRVHENRQVKFIDRAGNEYNLNEFKKLLPQVYVRDLLLRNEYNELINHKIIPSDEMIYENFYFITRPSDISQYNIKIKLAPIFETKSGSANLEMPIELARIDKDITFINNRDRKINIEKSALFTNALKEAGFIFPVVRYGNNPDAKKSFDAGIFLVDKENKLFRLYMEKDEPIIEKYSADLVHDEVIYISISENPQANFYGYMITKDINEKDKYNIYVINVNNTISQLEVDKFNPYTENLRINQNPLHTLITIAGITYQHIIVLNKDDNKIVKTYDIAESERLIGAPKIIYNMIFPFITYNDRQVAGEYLKVEKTDNIISAAIFILFLIAIYIFINKKFSNLSGKNIIIDIVFIIFGGIYAFIALVLLLNFKRDKLWD